MTKTTAAILTILTDAAAQVDRARPADARNGPGWDGPGAEWWEDFTETVEQQLDAGDVAADATAKEQRDVVERLDDDDLETIVACIKNGQPGRVTPYEIKAMCEELIHLRASQAGRVPAGALSLRDLKREIANTKNDLNGLALIGCVPLWSSLTSRLDELYERLSASPPPPATDGDALREALRGSMHALQALLNAVKTNPAMQGRQYIDLGIQVNTAIDKARNVLASSPPLAATDAAQSFQDQVAPWMMTCFGAEIAADRLERNDRFIEEALELVQASGYSAERAHQLVGYVFGRDQGDINQEVGGVMVTLAAHCLAHGVDMHAAAETELARVWTKVDAIRAKQASKPRGSALPIPAPVSATDAVEAERAIRADEREACAALADPRTGPLTGPSHDRWDRSERDIRTKIAATIRARGTDEVGNG